MSKINIGDAWKSIEKIKVNVGDSWKTVDSASINIGDVWKNFYSSVVSNGLLTSLVSYYKMDGSFLDEEGNNNGIVNGGTYDSNGIINDCISLDGNNDYVDLGTNDSLNFTGSFSVNIWVYNEDSGREKAIISRYEYDANERQYYLYKSGANDFNFRVSNSGTSAISCYTPCTFNEWTMITGVCNTSDNNLKIYLNGVLKTTSAFTGVPYSTTQSTGIGRLMNTPVTAYFDGKLDEGGFWGKALIQTEITSLYNSGDGLSYNNFTT